MNYLPLCIALVAAGLNISCLHGVECTSMDYSSDQCKLPNWECRQTFDYTRDSPLQPTYLKVVAYPLKEYPGITMPWFTGNWKPYSYFHIIIRLRSGPITAFVLSLWDGDGAYTAKNRFEKTFLVDTAWTECTVALHGGLLSAGNRAIDLSKIKQITFSTANRARPFEFHIARIGLN